MRVLDLFSGIGGAALGLERAGFSLEAFCEIDAGCRETLSAHWPGVTVHEDVRGLDGREYHGVVDLIIGGFPCQDLSTASHGAGAGLNGGQSGLWHQMARVVDEARPRFCVVENVDGAAWKRWVPTVRSALWRLGYTSLSIRLRAVDLGAPFDGSRVFVAATNGDGESARAFHAEVAKLPKPTERSRHWRCAEGVALGMDDGISGGLAMYGNAIMPQMSEAIGRAIMESAA